MKIKLLLTGGTIDKQYDELAAELAFAETHLPDMLRQARSKVDVDIEQLMLVDSLDIGEGEHQQILKSCKSSDTDKIIITHGTSSMLQTAEMLGSNIIDKNDFISWLDDSLRI